MWSIEASDHEPDNRLSIVSLYRFQSYNALSSEVISASCRISNWSRFPPPDEELSNRSTFSLAHYDNKGWTKAVSHHLTTGFVRWFPRWTLVKHNYWLLAAVKTYVSCPTSKSLSVTQCCSHTSLNCDSTQTLNCLTWFKSDSTHLSRSWINSYSDSWKSEKWVAQLWLIQRLGDSTLIQVIISVSRLWFDSTHWI